MLKHAKNQAKRSEFIRARVGAVIAKSDRILSTGHNYIGHNRFVGGPYPESTHAEASAISKLLREYRFRDLIGSTLYIVRIGRIGDLRFSKPCNFCEDLIRSVGIKRVVYTIDDQTTGTYDC